MSKIILALAALLFASSAFSQAYVGAGVAAVYGTDQDSDPFIVPAVGYRFGRYLAVEGAYFDPGNLKETITRNPSAPGTVDVTTSTLEVSGVRLSLIGTVQLVEKLDAFASLSGYRLKGERRTVNTFTPASGIAQTLRDQTQSGSGTTYGVGFGFASNITQAIQVRLALDLISGKDNMFGDGSEMPSTRMASLSAFYRF